MPNHGGTDDWLDQAIALHRKGHTDQARALYEKVLAARPDDADANHLLGVIDHQEGRLDSALTRMLRARKRDPANAVLLNNLGSLYRALGRRDMAIKTLETGLAVSARLPALHCNLGICRREAGQYDSAIASLRNALALQPRYAEAQNNLGLCLAALGRPAEAVAAFETLYGMAPGFPKVLENLGTALLECNRNGSAITVLEKAIAASPSADAYYKLGLALGNLELHARALAALDQAIARDPGNARAQAQRARSLAGLGRFEEALAVLDKAVGLDGKDKQIHVVKALILGDHGRSADSIAAHEEVLRLDPDWGESYRLIAWSGKHEADSDFAARAHAAYARSAPDSESRKHLAFALGKLAEDRQAYREAFAFFLEGNRLLRRDFTYSTKAAEQKVDQICETFDPALFARFKGHGHASRAPIFIIGMPRSGTTLIEAMLASHPDVIAGGETFPFGAAAQKAGLSDSVHPPPYRFGTDPDICRKTGDCYLDLAGERLDTRGRFTDKLPMNFFNAGMIHLAMPGARIIHCRRSPADTCLSIFKNYMPSPQLGYSCDLKELGAHYRLYRRVMAHWEKVMPGVIHHVDYEAVVAEPEARLRELLAYCALDWDDACLAFHEAGHRVRSSSAHQVRRPVYTSSVGLYERYGDDLAPLLAELER